jgi:hypothetical protein
MLEIIRSSETSVLTSVTRRHIPGSGILHSHRRENLKSYIALAGWALKRRCNVSPVRYELGVYIREDILHSNCSENLKPNKTFINSDMYYIMFKDCNNTKPLHVTRLIVTDPYDTQSSKIINSLYLSKRMLMAVLI